MADIIRLAEARRPGAFSEQQEEFCSKLIGMGLTRPTIASLILKKDVNRLTHADLGAAFRLISRQAEGLGYGIMDSRRGGSPWAASAIRDAARSCRVRVRLAA